MNVQERVEARDGHHAVIVCHPDPDSFNHAIATTYCDTVRTAGQRVVVRDLYAMGFDPVLKADERSMLGSPVRSDDVVTELDGLAGSDVFVLIYPIWFGSAPAMLKDYVERVLGAGVPREGVLHQVRRSPLATRP